MGLSTTAASRRHRALATTARTVGVVAATARTATTAGTVGVVAATARTAEAATTTDFQRVSGRQIPLKLTFHCK